MAEQQKQFSNKYKLKKRETFDEWLKRKRTPDPQEQFSSDTDDDDSYNSRDNEDDKNSDTFNEWIKELQQRPTNEENPRSVAHLNRKKSRAIKGLIVIESSNCKSKTEVRPDTSVYMKSMDDWRKNRKKSDNVEERVSTVPEAKKALEERRKQFLAEAITYDEWMDHTEERQKFTYLIMNANHKQLDSLDKISKKHGKKEVTFQEWCKQAEEKSKQKKKDNIRMSKENEEENGIMAAYRYGGYVSHEDWLKARSSTKPSAPITQSHSKTKPKKGLSLKEDEFNAWVNRKHKGEKEKIELSIRKEKELLMELRERRLTAMA